MYKLRLVILCLCVAFCMTSCGNDKIIVTERDPEDFAVTVRLKAVGDNLFHSTLYKRYKTGDEYDFSGVYDNIKPYIEDADIAAINQETILVENNSSVSGYPAFGTPDSLAKTIVDAGFDVITHATNHTLDKGVKAIEHSLSVWDEFSDVTVLGIRDDIDDMDKIHVLKRDDLMIGALNFTYGLNGYTLPGDKEYMIDLYEEERVSELLKTSEQNCDFTVVFIHFGTEYVHKPTQQQQEWAEFLCENGADLIIGTHPHVVQPVEEIESENGNTAVVFYSLGNFISGQKTLNRVLGAMADVTIKKINGKTKIESYRMLPIVTHVGDEISVYMLSDYTDELAKSNRRAPGLTVKKLQNLFDEICGKEIDEESEEIQNTVEGDDGEEMDSLNDEDAYEDGLMT